MISYHLLTEAGDRDHNEDNIGMIQSGDDYCFVLADGLGGHGKGELASRLAVEAAVSAFVGAGTASTPCLVEAVNSGQRAILKAQKEDRSASDMKTTLVLMLIGKNMIQWAHVGDSRLYYFQDGKLISRTCDHSVPQMLVSAGQLKERQIRHHPDRNRLLRVLGIDWEEPKYQLGEPLSRQPGQAFLLCSDGFWEYIEEKKMAACLKKADSAEDWLKKMELIVIRQGKGHDMDNYSAIAVWT